MSKRFGRLVIAIFGWCLVSSGPGYSQDGQLHYRYCTPSGTCGLPGSNAPLTSAPPQLRDADLAGRRYGPEGAQFISEVQQEQNSIAALKQSMASLEGTPFAIDMGALNKEVLDYFSRPNLFQDLKSVYAAPTPIPAGGLPAGVANGLDQTWQSLTGGQASELVRAATLVRGLQRQAMALSDLGNQQASQYLQAELRRNFLDANGLLRFLGNHDVYARVAPLTTPDPRLTFRMIDGVNKVITADFLLRQAYGGKLPVDVAASLGAIAAGYHAAANVGQKDQGLAYTIADGLDSTLRVFDAFFSGFFDQAADTIDALVSFAKNPSASIGAIARAIENYRDTAQLIGKMVQAKYSDFKTGDAEQRANIIGEISFDVATTFLGAGAAKYGAKAVEFVAENGARLAVTRAMVRVSRTASLGEGISVEAKAGLSFVEAVRPDAALALYDKSPAIAARVGEELNAFLTSGQQSTIRQTGEEFLRASPAALSGYLDEAPKVMQTLDAGGSVKVYLAVDKEYAQELLTSGLKGQTFKKWAERAVGTPLEEQYRYGVGRYVASSPETAMLEKPGGFNAAAHDLIEAEFKTVANGGKGYRIYPSVQSPGKFNVFDGAFDDFGAFKNPKVVP